MRDDTHDKVIQIIRKKDNICKIIAISHKSIFDIVDTLWLGIDDFIEKVRIEELLIRIRLLKRRISPINVKQEFVHNDFCFYDRRKWYYHHNHDSSRGGKHLDRLFLFAS